MVGDLTTPVIPALPVPKACKELETGYLGPEFCPPPGHPLAVLQPRRRAEAAATRRPDGQRRALGNAAMTAYPQHGVREARTWPLLA